MSIEVRHLTKTFNAHQALRDVSLAVPDGELTALLAQTGEAL